MLFWKGKSIEQPPRVALVMSGGGARAAYQVGFLQCLARHFPQLQFPIITGVSAGAINAVFLAAHPGSLQEAADDLASVWSSLQTDKVYKTAGPSLAMQVGRWGIRLLTGGLGRKTQGMVNTQPLRQLLQRVLGVSSGEPIEGIQQNIASGKLRALALATTNYTNGYSVIWVEGKDVQPWVTDSRAGVRTRITVDHVMASAALPLFFPAVRIGPMWYGDGGIRLFAPLSPAIRLGADRILAVSTSFKSSVKDPEEVIYTPEIAPYPSPAQILGVLFNAIFLDTLDRDAETLTRLTRLLRRLPPEEREGLRPIDALVMRPSVNLARLAREYEPQLPPTLRFLLRGMGVQEAGTPDWLSMLLFEREYIDQLIAIGRQDAEQIIEDVASLLAEEVA